MHVHVCESMFRHVYLAPWCWPHIIFNTYFYKDGGSLNDLPLGGMKLDVTIAFGNKRSKREEDGMV